MQPIICFGQGRGASAISLAAVQDALTMLCENPIAGGVNTNIWYDIKSSNFNYWANF